MVLHRQPAGVASIDSLQSGAFTPTDIVIDARLGNVAAVEPDRFFCPHRMAFRSLSCTVSTSATVGFVATNPIAPFGVANSHAISDPGDDVYTLATNGLGLSRSNSADVVASV